MIDIKKQTLKSTASIAIQVLNIFSPFKYVRTGTLNRWFIWFESKVFMSCEMKPISTNILAAHANMIAAMKHDISLSAQRVIDKSKGKVKTQSSYRSQLFSWMAYKDE